MEIPLLLTTETPSILSYLLRISAGNESETNILNIVYAPLFKKVFLVFFYSEQVKKGGTFIKKIKTFL